MRSEGGEGERKGMRKGRAVKRGKTLSQILGSAPVLFLLFFYSRCPPPCPAICKSGGACPIESAPLAVCNSTAVTLTVLIPERWRHFMFWMLMICRRPKILYPWYAKCCRGIPGGVDAYAYLLTYLFSARAATTGERQWNRQRHWLCCVVAPDDCLRCKHAAACV